MRRFCAIIVSLCVLLVQMNFAVLAQDGFSPEVDVFSSLDGDTVSDVKGLYMVGHSSVSEENLSLGGKASDDIYTKIVTDTVNQTYFNLKGLKSNGNLDKKYVVLCADIYGNKGSITPKIRYSGSLQPNIPENGSYISKDDLKADSWNNIMLVLNTEDNIAYYVVNGIKSAERDLGKYLDENNFSGTPDPELRLVFGKSTATSEVVVYYDNAYAYKTDKTPALVSTIYTLSGDSTGSDATSIMIKNGQNPASESKGLGGKSMDDSYTGITTHASESTFINLQRLSREGNLDRKYVVLSANIYGNKTDLIAKIRYNVGDPNLGVVSKTSLEDGKWNNLTLVYNTVSKTAYYICNGVKGEEFDCIAYLEGRGASVDLEPQLRIALYEKNTTVYYDDVVAYKTDWEPMVEYGNLPGECGDINNSVVIMKNDETADYTSYGAIMKQSCDSEVWESAVSVKVGDTVAVEKVNTDINGVFTGKTYKYVRFVDSGYSNILADQTTMVFEQKGNPYDNEGNRIADTRKNVDNVFGSGKTMEFIGVGVNDSGAKQSFYRYVLPVAERYHPRYLVSEVDFAFAKAEGNVVPVTGFQLTTNSGVSIGSSVNGNKYENRVNHYLWIYDTYKATYTEFVNGVCISDGVSVNDKFSNGAYNQIRFVFNGMYEASDAGNLTKIYGGYFADATLTECNMPPVTGGKVSENITWTYDADTYTMILSGSGKIPDWSDAEHNKAYWNEYAQSAEKLVIGEGITALGNDLFNVSTKLAQVIIPDSVTSIGSGAFVGSDNITLYCNSESYALSWSEKNDVAFSLLDREFYITYSPKDSTAAVYNFTGDRTKAVVVFAGYKNSDMNDVYYESLTLDKGKNEIIASDFSNSNGTTVKIMILDSFEKLVPLCDVYSTRIIPTIRIAGDSISAKWDVSRYGQQGWGEPIQDLWNDDINVINDAVSGWTTERYYNEKWPYVKADMKAGDYLLVSYLHNDYYVPINDSSKTNYIDVYREYLQKLIDETKEMGVQIVLVVPPNRGVSDNFHGDFAYVMPALAEENNVPCIDIHAKTIEMLNTDLEGTKQLLYMYKLVEQGIITQAQLEIHSNATFRTNGEDLTHLSTRGAVWVADYVAQNLVTLLPELAPYKK